MKWAAANTRLSLDTETLNSLRADIASPLTPSALEQRDEDGSASEVGRGTRIPGVALVPQLAVERRYVLASGGTPHPARVEHRAGALRHGGGGLPPELAGRSEEHTSELQSLAYLVCRLLLEKKKNYKYSYV